MAVEDRTETVFVMFNLMMIPLVGYQLISPKEKFKLKSFPTQGEAHHTLFHAVTK